MNYERAKIIALLRGTTLLRCTSGSQIVYCRALDKDEIAALGDKAVPVFLTRFSGMQDARLMSGFTHMVDSIGAVLPDQIRVFSFKYPNAPKHYDLGKNWSRILVEPLEDDEDE